MFLGICSSRKQQMGYACLLGAVGDNTTQESLVAPPKIPRYTMSIQLQYYPNSINEGQQTSGFSTYSHRLREATRNSLSIGRHSKERYRNLDISPTAANQPRCNPVLCAMQKNPEGIPFVPAAIFVTPLTKQPRDHVRLGRMDGSIEKPHLACDRD